METNGRFQIISLNDRGRGIRDLRKRREHKRTKTGCLTCRAKRVKCDEVKPVCVRCLRNARPCTYVVPQVTQYASDGGNGGVIKLSILSAFTVDPLDSLDARTRRYSNHVLRHFQRYWDQIIHMPGIHRILWLAQSSPLLYNAVLSTAACHLRHISPDIVQYRVIEHLYHSIVLEQYQHILATSRQSLNESDGEAFLISSTLLNIMTFPLLESSTSKVGPGINSSWILSSCDDFIGWLALQAGLRSLITLSSTMASQIETTRNIISKTILGWDGDDCPSVSLNSDLSLLPPSWIKAFNLKEPESIAVFGMPIMLLELLKSIEPLRLNVFTNLLFIWKLPIPFRDLLQKRDEKAIWLFGYWLGLLNRYEEAWWCKERVRRDYHAIHMWFCELRVCERPGSEGKMWQELMDDFKSASVFVCT